MNKNIIPSVLVILGVLITGGMDTSAADKVEAEKANGKLKIFILAGQSNMVGFGQLKDGVGTMEWYIEKKPKAYGHLVDENGKPVVRD
ncbi:MAG: sialate O-acetylesterase, partial [Verrucomicrobia bacterium]|nr:sialate O-acetylesterase [Verrucomicrobiota bacterium]